jgi:undecaprenyl pyrophosphate synthase
MPVLTFAQRLSETTLDRLQRALLTVLRAGPIPQHVAFVMDGNRRYARNKGMKVIQGHVDGFVALRRVRLSHSSLLPAPQPREKHCFMVG